MRPDGDRPVLGKRFKTLIISYLGNHIDDCDCIENNEGCSLKTIWRSAQFRESSRWNAFHNILPILHQIERELGSKLKRVFGEYISTPAILDFSVKRENFFTIAFISSEKSKKDVAHFCRFEVKVGDRKDVLAKAKNIVIWQKIATLFATFSQQNTQNFLSHLELLSSTVLTNGSGKKITWGLILGLKNFTLHFMGGVGGIYFTYIRMWICLQFLFGQIDELANGAQSAAGCDENSINQTKIFLGLACFEKFNTLLSLWAEMQQ